MNLWPYMSPSHSQVPLQVDTGTSGIQWWGAVRVLCPPGCHGPPVLRAAGTCTFPGYSETKTERSGTAHGEPTFIVDLEVKEYQRPVFCLGVSETLIRCLEEIGALQLEATGLTAAIIQLVGGLQHKRANRSGVQRPEVLGKMNLCSHTGRCRHVCTRGQNRGDAQRRV